MIKYLLLATIIFITTSCTTVVKKWNTPYIDTDETLKLYYGMPKSDVLSALGRPLYVEQGWPNGAANEIVWVYEVRTQYIASDVSSTGEVTIVKTPSSRKPNIPGFVIHKLSLTFKNGELSHWKSLKEDKASSVLPIPNSDQANTNDTKTIASTKKREWSVQPKLTRSFNSWDGYINSDGQWWGENDTYVAGDDTSLRLGLNIGKPMLGMLVGFDVSGGAKGAGIMLFADKAIGGWHLVLSMGKDIHEGDYKIEGFSKVGIFKDFGTASYGLEKMSRQGGDLTASSTFVTLKYNLTK